MASGIQYAIFTKPWKDLSIDALGQLVRDLGFDGIEFPLRDGYQVEPANAEKGLRALTEHWREAFGLRVFSIAAGTPASATESMFAGCAAAGIPVIRVMAPIDPGKGYRASEAASRREIEAALPLCERYGVQLAVQMHCDWWIANAMELYNLLEGYDHRYITGIWDAAHSGLAGEQPESALEVLWDRLSMVNLKNACYKLMSGPEASPAVWGAYFTTGDRGLCSWARTVAYLKKRDYAGVLCFPAEYTDEANTVAYIARDIAYVKSLF